MNPQSWQFFTTASSIWDGMLADIRKTQKSIDIEQYGFYDDQAGRRFLEIFEEKLKQGVAVRMICDATGSWPLFFSSYVKHLRSLGLEIQSYNRPQIHHPKLWFRRTHRKLMVVDSRIAWVGGLGMKEKVKNFRDTQARLDGRLVGDVASAFDDMWRHIQNPKQPLFERRFPEADEIQFMVNYPGYQEKQIYEWLRSAVAGAQQRIYLTTSYFFPDRNFFQLILDKAKQGVDVKIILRGKDDEYIPVRFSSSYFSTALANQIKIYRYMPNVMHAKTFIIDDVASIGSSNLDKFSFYYNLEANLVSKNSEFVNALSEQFLADLKSCRQVTTKEWSERPLRERVFETLVWPIHNYL